MKVTAAHVPGANCLTPGALRTAKRTEIKGPGSRGGLASAE